MITSACVFVMIFVYKFSKTYLNSIYSHVKEQNRLIMYAVKT